MLSGVDWRLMCDKWQNTIDNKPSFFIGWHEQFINGSSTEAYRQGNTAIIPKKMNETIKKKPFVSHFYLFAYKKKAAGCFYPILMRSEF